MSVHDRLEQSARTWKVDIERTIETRRSLIGLGRRGSRPLAIKVVKQFGAEWPSKDFVYAFSGPAFVRTVGWSSDGTLLMDRLSGGQLSELVVGGRDDEATDVLASIIAQMDELRHVPPSCPSVREWGRSFDRYLESGRDAIRRELVVEAARWFQYLVGTQRRPRLLHGDLHHDNVLFDSHRGWVAIDPKGVVGEREYEIGAALRNPCERPDLFLPLPVIERRLGRFARALDLDLARAREWAFAQAVLSAVWMIEDREAVGESSPIIHVAMTIRATLPSAP